MAVVFEKRESQEARTARLQETVRQRLQAALDVSGDVRKIDRMEEAIKAAQRSVTTLRHHLGA